MLERLQESRKREEELRLQNEISLENFYSNQPARGSITTPHGLTPGTGARNSLILPRSNITSRHSPRLSMSANFMMPAGYRPSANSPDSDIGISASEYPDSSLQNQPIQLSEPTRKSLSIEVSSRNTPDSTVCDHCSENLVVFICNDCQAKTRLCESCFALLHKAPSKKSHRFEKLEADSKSALSATICHNCDEFPAVVNCQECAKIYCGYFIDIYFL